MVRWNDIKDQKPTESPGSFESFYRKANELESITFIIDFEKLKFYKDIINSIKENNPEVLI